MRFSLLLIFNLLASAAFAQQQSTSTAVDRLANSLGQCVATAEKQVDQLADIQKQLSEAKNKIKELETKK